jgi:hypothetical protein
MPIQQRKYTCWRGAEPVTFGSSFQTRARSPLRGHSKAANKGHLKTGQREQESGTLIPRSGVVAFVGMSNVLSEAKRQQAIALGRLGWPLRRIEQETGVRRETASAYLKAAGVGVRPPGRKSRCVVCCEGHDAPTRRTAFVGSPAYSRTGFPPFCSLEGLDVR